MKPIPPLALLAAVLCGLGAGACGGATSATIRKSAALTATSSSSSAQAANRLKGDGDEDGQAAIAKERTKPDADGDSDNEGNGYYDWDDSNVFDYGHPANAADGQAITSVVKHYYAAALRSDGPVVCRLVTATVAKSIRREFGQAAGPLAVGGTTCAVTMSRLLTRLRPQISVAGRPPAVDLVRIEGLNAHVLLTSEGAQANRYIVVRRERNSWKVDALLDIGLP